MSRTALAFRFDCDKTLDQLAAALNAAGTWRWQGRESYWYGDYLSCRPAQGIRARIHDHAQATTHTQQVRPKPIYTMQVDIDADPELESSAVVDIAKESLAKSGATNISEIEPYDSQIWRGPPF